VFRGMAVKAFSRTRPPGKRSHSSMRYDACRLVPGGINPFTEPGGGAASQIWPNPLHGSREMGLLCWGGEGGQQRGPATTHPSTSQLSGKINP
jgi:hypothetical protein